MFGLRKYRLQERQPVGAGFDLVDLESEGIIGVASPGVVETAPRVVETAKRESTWTALVGSLTERLEAIFAPVLGVFFLAGLIFGRASLIPNPDSRPRLILRRPDGGMVLTLRVSSGLLYDSRRVYDGEGRLIAQFRSFKASVRGGFKIIDLRGCEERGGDIGVRPGLASSNPREMSSTSDWSPARRPERSPHTPRRMLTRPRRGVGKTSILTTSTLRPPCGRMRRASSSSWPPHWRSPGGRRTDERFLPPGILILPLGGFGQESSLLIESLDRGGDVSGEGRPGPPPAIGRDRSDSHVHVPHPPSPGRPFLHPTAP